MKHSKVLAFIIAFIALLPLSAEKVGDTVTKEVTIRGKTESKKMTLFSFSEYDKNGNEIYSELRTSWEKFEYNARGQKVHRINAAGTEEWYEYKYDSVGNLVYEKSTSNRSKKPTEW